MSLVNIESEISGSIWKLEKSKGEVVKEGDLLATLESMKMEIPITSTKDGVIKEVKVEEGDAISEGDVLMVIEE